ncbi:2-oxoglutarate dehydrogenase E1 component [Streptomyces griseomycini]
MSPQSPSNSSISTDTDQAGKNPAAAFGANEWLVDEIYQQYLQDPNSVDRAWWDFFADYKPGAPATSAPAGTAAAGAAGTTTPTAQPAAPARPAAPAPAAAQPAPAAPAQPAAKAPAPPAQAQAQAPAKAAAPAAKPAAAKAEPAGEAKEGPEQVTLRGPSAAVAKNMDASLELPTATSVRAVPVKLLFDNRIVINNHLKRARGGKISFTHIIGYAMVQAIKAMPSMNWSYAKVDGKPTLVKPEHVNLGLAIDLVKPNGDRQLVVAAIKKAETLNFFEFWQAYEDIVRRARDNKLTMDDFTGVTVSLTNPGGLGTVHSVPRLMPGQSVIMGVGSMDYPAEFQGTSQDTLNKLGISKVMTLTSTYDHRVIQGAASGEFLRAVANLLLGENNFYDDIFEALRIPYEPVRWLKDIDASHDDDVTKAARVFELIHSYRVRGHVMADTDPLEYRQRKHPDLDIVEHGLTLWDLEREFAVGGFAGKSMMKLRDILGVLRDSYCRTTGIEFMHIQDPKQRKWIQDRVERGHSKPEREEQLRILRRLNAAEAFETFLQTKYVGQKRFSLEGGESVIPLLDAVLDSAAESRLDEVVIGMAHRGRLNVLANIVGKSYAQIFREFEGNLDPKSMHGSGDVKYHLGAEGTFTGLDGEQIKVSLVANPSHLEAVDPVLEGVARAKQDIIGKGGTDFTVLPVAIHGDAAFAGQGVVAETLNMSQLRGYRTGGTVHIVINNQVGFTAAPESSRSSMYATDVARMIEAPIFHVNGDDPEAVVRVARLAFEFRQAFNKDVVIDLICYRRRGHNESDNPAFTQPLMYDLIDKKRSVRKLYTESLIGRGDITLEEAEQALQDYQGQLEKVFTEVREGHQPARCRGDLRPAGRVPGRREHRGDHGGRQADRRVPGQHPRPHHRPPAAAAAACSAGRRWSRTAPSTGAWARPSPSARCSSRASRSDWPASSSAAPSASATRSSSTSSGGFRHARERTPRAHRQRNGERGGDRRRFRPSGGVRDRGTAPGGHPGGRHPHGGLRGPALEGLPQVAGPEGVAPQRGGLPGRSRADPGRGGRDRCRRRRLRDPGTGGGEGDRGRPHPGRPLRPGPDGDGVRKRGGPVGHRRPALRLRLRGPHGRRGLRLLRAGGLDQRFHDRGPRSRRPHRRPADQRLRRDRDPVAGSGGRRGGGQHRERCRLQRLRRPAGARPVGRPQDHRPSGRGQRQAAGHHRLRFDRPAAPPGRGGRAGRRTAGRLGGQSPYRRG